MEEEKNECDEVLGEFFYALAKYVTRKGIMLRKHFMYGVVGEHARSFMRQFTGSNSPHEITFDWTCPLIKPAWESRKHLAKCLYDNLKLVPELSKDGVDRLWEKTFRGSLKKYDKRKPRNEELRIIIEHLNKFTIPLGSLISEEIGKTQLRNDPLNSTLAKETAFAVFNYITQNDKFDFEKDEITNFIARYEPITTAEIIMKDIIYFMVLTEIETISSDDFVSFNLYFTENEFWNLLQF